MKRRGILVGRRTLFILMFASSVLSSERTMHTVSLPFFPLSSTVSPRNSCSSSILAALKHTTELSSLVASSTTRRFGAFFLSMIPVLMSLMSAMAAFGPDSSGVSLAVLRQSFYSPPLFRALRRSVVSVQRHGRVFAVICVCVTLASDAEGVAVESSDAVSGLQTGRTEGFVHSAKSSTIHSYHNKLRTDVQRLHAPSLCQGLHLESRRRPKLTIAELKDASCSERAAR